MVVLAWLKSPAARWKTFVANRVNQIQETFNVEDWNHISSKENPADLVSVVLTLTSWEIQGYGGMVQTSYS